MPEPTLSLDALRPGWTARVQAVSGEGALRRRLLEMGLTPGARVEMLRAAPFGDPLQVRLRGYSVTLRRADAARVTLFGPARRRP